MPPKILSGECGADGGAPDNVRPTHQSLHHVVAHAPGSDEDILEAVRHYALPAMQEQAPIDAEDHGRTAGNQFSNQTGNCLGTDPHGRGSRDRQ